MMLTLNETEHFPIIGTKICFTTIAVEEIHKMSIIITLDQWKNTIIKLARSNEFEYQMNVLAMSFSPKNMLSSCNFTGLKHT